MQDVLINFTVACSSPAPLPQSFPMLPSVSQSCPLSAMRLVNSSQHPVCIRGKKEVATLLWGFATYAGAIKREEKKKRHGRVLGEKGGGGRKGISERKAKKSPEVFLLPRPTRKEERKKQRPALSSLHYLMMHSGHMGKFWDWDTSNENKLPLSSELCSGCEKLLVIQLGDGRRWNKLELMSFTLADGNVAGKTRNNVE